MSLYSGTLQEFIDETCDEIVGKMLKEFPKKCPNYSNDKPDEKEVDSWKTSIPILKLIFSSYLEKEMRKNSKIFLEYIINDKRADCILKINNNIIVLEFKNYDKYPQNYNCEKKDIEQLENYMKNLKINSEKNYIEGYVFYTGNYQKEPSHEKIILSRKLKHDKSEHKLVKKIKNITDTKDYFYNLEKKWSNLEGKTTEIIINEVANSIKDGNERYNFIEVSSREEKTLIGLQLLKIKLEELNQKNEEEIKVSYITKSNQIRDFLRLNNKIFEELDSKYIQSFDEIGNMVEREILIFDEVERATTNDIENIIKNNKIQQVIFLLTKDQPIKEEKLMSQLVDMGYQKIIIEDIEFTSPSTAGVMCTGTSQNS